ncbi:MAG: ECF transporter S component [Clostridiales bacterium]|nr:ECF transporter S component [Clostridiales bacterium]
MNKVSNTSVKTLNHKVSLTSTRGLTTIAMLSAISVILMLFEIPLWFAPSFYEIDLSEVPVLIGAFALGPVAGVVIEFIKILLNLIINGTVTAFVGEFANLLIGCALVVPAAMLYQSKKTRKSATIGLIIGTVFMTAVGSVLNAYLLLPVFAKAFNMPMEALIEMGTAVNPNIQSLSGFILLAVTPFNLLKGIIVSLVTLLLYKRVSRIIKGFHD